MEMMIIPFVLFITPEKEIKSYKFKVNKVRAGEKSPL